MLAVLALAGALWGQPVLDVQQRTPPAPACTRESPCIGPNGGRYYITPSGARRYLPRR